MIKTTQQRFDELKAMEFKCFASPEFESAEKNWSRKDKIARKLILAEMPDYDKFLHNKAKIDKLRQNQEPGFVLSYYQMPLLSKDQEYHLFRKYNFLKFCAIKKIKRMITPNASIIKHIDNDLSKARELKEMLVLCNSRLSNTIVQQIKGYAYVGSISDDLIQECQADICKFIDYFDYTLGVKFSTYSIWGMKKNNMNRYYKAKKEITTNLDLGENSFDLNDLPDDQYHASTEMQEKIDVTNDLLALLEKNHERYYKVIIALFGIDGKGGRTLSKLGKEMKISRERVRQIKDKAIHALQKIAKEHKITA